MTRTMFVEAIYFAAELHRLTVTCGPRTKERNFEVGGHRNSYHQWSRGGFAADLGTDTRRRLPEDEEKRLVYLLREFGISCQWHSDHYHCQPSSHVLPRYSIRLLEDSSEL